MCVVFVVVCKEQMFRQPHVQGQSVQLSGVYGDGTARVVKGIGLPAVEVGLFSPPESFPREISMPLTHCCSSMGDSLDNPTNACSCSREPFLLFTDTADL